MACATLLVYEANIPSSYQALLSRASIRPVGRSIHCNIPSDRRFRDKTRALRQVIAQYQHCHPVQDEPRIDQMKGILGRYQGLARY